MILENSKQIRCIYTRRRLLAIPSRSFWNSKQIRCGHTCFFRGIPTPFWFSCPRKDREHRIALYTELLTSGGLNDYLAELDESAEVMLFRLVKELAEKEGVTEKLKAEDGMK